MSRRSCQAKADLSRCSRAVAARRRRTCRAVAARRRRIRFAHKKERPHTTVSLSCPNSTLYVPENRCKVRTSPFCVLRTDYTRYKYTHQAQKHIGVAPVFAPSSVSQRSGRAQEQYQLPGYASCITEFEGGGFVGQPPPGSTRLPRHPSTVIFKLTGESVFDMNISIFGKATYAPPPSKARRGGLALQSD